MFVLATTIKTDIEGLRARVVANTFRPTKKSVSLISVISAFSDLIHNWRKTMVFKISCERKKL